MEEHILHYGVKRRSGRYPWGSGEDPFQGEGLFLSDYRKLRDSGMSEIDIANEMGLTTTQLRNSITYATKQERDFQNQQITTLKEQGLSNTDIAKQLGVSEGTVRNRLTQKKSPKVSRSQQLENVESVLAESLERTGHLDVGVGVERQLGVNRNTFNAVVNHMVENGDLYIHNIQIKRLADPSKYTTVKVLSKEKDYVNVLKDSDNIGNLEYQSEDRSMSMPEKFKPPVHVDLNRIMIRYAEDGGAEKDGLIELRPGVEDLDLKNARYAQVRIAAGDDLYMKGMATYTDSKLPDGIDIVYNVTKSRGTPKEGVFKKMKADPSLESNPETLFGTSLKQQGQRGALNILNEEGDWDTWSTTMSSQFLSKQPLNLIREQLGKTYNSLVNEYNELTSLTNPIVRRHLIDKFSQGLDSKARILSAKGLPGTKNHVILPMPGMKANEIYAPNYNNGDRVALVRHPHGGIFEIGDVIVNNNNPQAKKLIGTDAPDAIIMHPSMAHKLSGADFDGDTVLVIPNNTGKIKSSRSLKELRNFDPNQYKITDPNHPHIIDKKNMKTIKPRTKELQMGIVSNLITDMTIKGASQSEIARAVKHSMVVIDSEKHGLDYKQSAIDNNITQLKRDYTTRLNPAIGKVGQGSSTIVSRSKRHIDISDPKFKAEDYSSGRAKEQEYVTYINQLTGLKNNATKQIASITNPRMNKVASEVYKPEVQSLNKKLNTALLNAPRERQAQILSNTLYFKNIKPGMDDDGIKKLKARSLAQARAETGASRSDIKVTEKEWEAIQARAVSAKTVNDILLNTNIDRVRELATPRQQSMTSAKASRAKTLLDGGYTYGEVAQALGVSPSAIRSAIDSL